MTRRFIFLKRRFRTAKRRFILQKRRLFQSIFKQKIAFVST